MAVEVLRGEARDHDHVRPGERLSGGACQGEVLGHEARELEDDRVALADRVHDLEERAAYVAAHEDPPVLDLEDLAEERRRRGLALGPCDGDEGCLEPGEREDDLGRHSPGAGEVRLSRRNGRAPHDEVRHGHVLVPVLAEHEADSEPLERADRLLELLPGLLVRDRHLGARAGEVARHRHLAAEGPEPEDEDLHGFFAARGGPASSAKSRARFRTSSPLAPSPERSGR